LIIALVRPPSKGRAGEGHVRIGALRRRRALGTVTAGHPATYEIDRWPADVGAIPYSAWRKTSDGTWVVNGSIKLGASVIDDVGVKGDAAARSLDKRCGK
jgi:hypothetical protein